MAVPLLDLHRQYEALRTEMDSAVLKVLEHGGFVLGPEVRELEAKIAQLSGVKHGIGVASGTDALLIALRAVGVEPGDEVITSDFSFFASAGVISRLGAKPVFVDIEPDTYNIDPNKIEAAITNKTKAIVPVHLFGQMADMAAFRALADRRGVRLLEDAAQAIGARQRTADGAWITTGTVGDACAFSFFPTKNLGAFGDAGMTVTPHADVAERLAKLRVHGGRQMYHHEEVGYNSRLDALQAAVLSAKLPHLPAWSEARRRNAAVYDAALADVDGVVTPVVRSDNESIFNQYTLRVRDGRRDALAAHLREKGIGSGVYYPVPLHLQDCFGYLGYREGQFPEAERACHEVLSLPVFPELTEAQLAYVADTIRAFFGG